MFRIHFHLFVDGSNNHGLQSHALRHTNVVKLVKEKRIQNRGDEEHQSIDISFPEVGIIGVGYVHYETPTMRCRNVNKLLPTIFTIHHFLQFQLGFI